MHADLSDEITLPEIPGFPSLRVASRHSAGDDIQIYFSRYAIEENGAMIGARMVMIDQ